MNPLSSFVYLLFPNKIPGDESSPGQIFSHIPTVSVYVHAQSQGMLGQLGASWTSHGSPSAAPWMALSWKDPTTCSFAFPANILSHSKYSRIFYPFADPKVPFPSFVWLRLAFKAYDNSS